MRDVVSYCSIARASEVVAQPWTPIILRNLLVGSSTFTELAACAPGMSRSLLSTRLRQLQRNGLITAEPNPRRKGRVYSLTEAGRASAPVLSAMGDWADRWLSPESVEPAGGDPTPAAIVQCWCTSHLRPELLPRRPVVVRFDFPDEPPGLRHQWAIFDGTRSEVCQRLSGVDEDLVVVAESRALVAWHGGSLGWNLALRAGRIRVSGPAALAAALPSWHDGHSSATDPDVEGALPG